MARPLRLSDNTCNHSLEYRTAVAISTDAVMIVCLACGAYAPGTCRPYRDPLNTPTLDRTASEGI